MSGDNQVLELIWENQFYRRLCFTMETTRIDWGESILVVGCSVHQNCVPSLICSVLVFSLHRGLAPRSICGRRCALPGRCHQACIACPAVTSFVKLPRTPARFFNFYSLKTLHW